MIRSMTGFGSAERVWEQWTIRAEVRSVNHSDLKLSIGLPSMLRMKETELARLVQEKAGRGHVYIAITCALAEEALEKIVDQRRLTSYMRLLKKLADQEGVPLHVELSRAISLPGVVRGSDNHTKERSGHVDLSTVR